MSKIWTENDEREVYFLSFQQLYLIPLEALTGVEDTTMFTDALTAYSDLIKHLTTHHEPL